MNFTELCNRVYTITNRPDLEDETKQAVYASTLKMHSLDFFPRDRWQSLAVFDEAAYIQELDTTSIPRFRCLSHIRKWDPLFNATQQNPLLPSITPSIGGQVVGSKEALSFIKILDPDDILDASYGTEKVNVAYMAGDMLYIRSNTLFSQAMIGWYQFPEIDAENGFARYDSWIADKFPFAIIYDAASVIFQQIGKNDESRKFDDPNNGLVAQQVNMLLRNSINAAWR
jgi:hypothetical protein